MDDVQPILLLYIFNNFQTGDEVYSETSLIRHSMGPENNVGLGGCWIIECLLPYWSMVTVPHNGWIRECWIIKVTD